MSDKVFVHPTPKKGPPNPFRGHKSKKVKDEAYEEKRSDKEEEVCACDGSYLSEGYLKELSKPFTRSEIIAMGEKQAGSLENMRFFREENPEYDRGPVNRKDDPEIDQKVHPFDHDSRGDYVMTEEATKKVVSNYLKTAGFSEKSRVATKVSQLDFEIKFKGEMQIPDQPEAQSQVADQILEQVFGQGWERNWFPVEFQLKPKGLKVTVTPR